MTNQELAQQIDNCLPERFEEGGETLVSDELLREVVKALDE